MNKIRIGIAGYGNLGKGVELAIRQNDDMELVGDVIHLLLLLQLQV
jgi:diaminopimelate dehydrogenase